MCGRRGIAGYGREIADSDFLGRDLTDRRTARTFGGVFCGFMGTMRVIAGYGREIVNSDFWGKTCPASGKVLGNITVKQSGAYTLLNNKTPQRG
jgi:hypothetical protein